jgi:hypothetical protein
MPNSKGALQFPPQEHIYNNTIFFGLLQVYFHFENAVNKQERLGA